MAKQRKQGSKASSSNLKNARETAAKQAVKKRSKGPNRISKDQVADVTAQINSEFAQVQTLYATQSKQAPSVAASAALPEPSVQDLAHVMMGL
ncbi:hypothetical protein LXA43DRAFT_1090048 [Ganoderma leucocontextum]|nr:hypothetical protein LXA43DRAFT_1090048 [Ganoderma leucocontextum]